MFKVHWSGTFEKHICSLPWMVFWECRLKLQLDLYLNYKRKYILKLYHKWISVKEIITLKENYCLKVPVFYLDISFLDKWTWTIGGRFGNDDRLLVEMSHQNRKDNSLKCLRVFRDKSITTIHQCQKRREQVKRRRTNCLPPFRRLQY